MDTKVAVTGTPGVGKTTVACRLSDELDAEYFDVTQAVRDGASSGYDDERNVPVADVGELREVVSDGDVVIDGHIAHLLEPDAVVVLRCSPDVLRSRLEERGWSDEKISENVESEALDIVLAEAVEAVGADAPVYEFDTTGATPEETTRRVVRAFEDDEERVGVVDWSDHIEETGREVRN